jgi:hypothetical protein
MWAVNLWEWGGIDGFVMKKSQSALTGGCLYSDLNGRKFLQPNRKRRPSCPELLLLWTGKCCCWVDRQTCQPLGKTGQRAMKEQSRATLNHPCG